MKYNQLPPPPTHIYTCWRDITEKVKSRFLNSYKSFYKKAGIFIFSAFLTGFSFAGGPKWSVAGNNVGNNDFLGTTNNQPLVFKTNNIEALRIVTNGNVGIGTSNPSARLDVNGNFHLSGDATLDSNLTVSGNLFLPLQAQSAFSLLSIDSAGKVLPFTFSGNANEVLLGNGIFAPVSTVSGWAINGNNLYTTTSGNVGIGTNTPTAKLDVIGNAIITGGVLTTQVTISSKVNSDTVSSGIINSDTATIGRIHIGGGIIGNEPLTVNGNAKISGTLYSGGLAVLGLSQFDSIKTDKMQVGDSSLVLSSTTTNSSIDNEIYVDPNTSACQNHTLYLQSYAGQKNKVPKNYNVVMCKDQQGHVGIGTANPTAQLHIRSTYCPGCALPELPCGSISLPQLNTAVIRLQDDKVNTSGNVLKTNMWDIAASGLDQRFYVKEDTSVEQSIALKPYFSMTDSGNFGIGTFDAHAKLSVVATGTKAISVLDNNQNEKFAVYSNGVVSIGVPENKLTTNTGTYKLYVADGIMTERCHISLLNSSEWGDFVFNRAYKRMNFNQQAKYYAKYRHLKGIPSSKDLKQNGIDVTKMFTGIVVNLEETRLDNIKLQKENVKLKSQLDKQEKEIEALNKQMELVLKNH